MIKFIVFFLIISQSVFCKPWDYQFPPGFEYPIGDKGAYIEAGEAKVKRMDKPRFLMKQRGRSAELFIGGGQPNSIDNIIDPY